MSYVPPHRRRKPIVVEDEPLFVLVCADSLDCALKDFGLDPIHHTGGDGLIRALEALAEAIGLDDTEVITNADIRHTFEFDKRLQGGKHHDCCYVSNKLIGMDAETNANTAVSEMNSFFKRLSGHLCQKRVQGMREHPSVLKATAKIRLLCDDVGNINNNQPLPPNIGSYGFVACVASEREIQKYWKAKIAIKKYYKAHVNKGATREPDSLSLALFRRPTDDARPTHVLSSCCWRRGEQKRELVGKGKLNLALDVSYADGARRELYEETFGLASALPGGIPLHPTLVWEGVAMSNNNRQWYASNFAMVVTDDDDGIIESLADTLSNLALEFESAFEKDPLSTVYPEIGDYEWTPVDQFQEKPWDHLYSKVVEGNIFSHVH